MRSRLDLIPAERKLGGWWLSKFLLALVCGFPSSYKLGPGSPYLPPERFIEVIYGVPFNQVALACDVQSVENIGCGFWGVVSVLDFFSILKVYLTPLSISWAWFLGSMGHEIFVFHGGGAFFCSVARWSATRLSLPSRVVGLDWCDLIHYIRMPLGIFCFQCRSSFRMSSSFSFACLME